LQGRARPGEEPGRPLTDGRHAPQVLVIDGDPVNTHLACDILQGSGFACASCEPGRALDAIAAQMPDLMLVDSIELCRRLRSHPSLQMTPILLAVRADAELRASALKAGASDLVARPFEARDLLASVRWYTQKMAEMREMPIRDGLTRAYNAEYFKLRLEEEMGRTRRYEEGFCVCLVEVDGFAALAKGYGRTAGDAVLAHLASLLTASVRMTDVVARHSEDEFALILVGCEPAEAGIVAGRIRQRIARQRFALPPLGGSSIDVSCTVSIGIAGFVKTDSLFSLLQRAGAALLEAKSAGRDQVRISQ
jgi:diguanylate cyclase (GGDEF)-like protein